MEDETTGVLEWCSDCTTAIEQSAPKARSVGRPTAATNLVGVDDAVVEGSYSRQSNAADGTRNVAAREGRTKSLPARGLSSREGAPPHPPTIIIYFIFP